MKNQELIYFNASGLRVTEQKIYAENSTYKNYVENREYSIDEVLNAKMESPKSNSGHPLVWGLHIVIVGIMIFDLYKIYHQTNIFIFILTLICIFIVWFFNCCVASAVKPKNTLITSIVFGICVFLGFGIVPRIFFYLAVLISSFVLIGITTDPTKPNQIVIIGTTSGNYTVGGFKNINEAKLAVQSIEKAIGQAQNYKNLQENSYSLRVSGETYGPYDLDTVRHLIGTRQINPNGCLCWKPGMIEWVSITEIPQLRELIPPPDTDIPSPRQINKQEPIETISKKQNLSQQEDPVDLTPIDLNNAPLADLLLLPYITIAQAEKLVREREIRLGFGSFDEVAEFLQLQPHIVTKLKAKAVILAYQSENISDAQDQRLIDF
ncbi:MAG: DUF4339 domain-containing protein [Microcystis aeruginosa BS13-10]|nr:DUF4339 domain-containing protein [Microcystis aeruginosa G13-09]NCS37945.1 DUF4339 domain-containing protein [Microcystis aeruginosa BS13-10]